MYTVIIADDEPMERKGLQMILEREFPDLRVVAQASTGDDLISLARLHDPDIAFVDIHMPGLNGLEAIEQLRGRGCTTHFIIMTAYSDFSYAQKAIGLHVEAYLLKPSRRDVTISTIRKVCAEIDEARVTMGSRQKVYQLFQQIQPVMEREILYSILVGEPSPASFDTYCFMHGITFTSGGIVFLQPIQKGSVTADHIEPLQRKLHTLLKGEIFLCSVNLSFICLLIFIPAQVPASRWEKYLADTVERLKTGLEKDGFAMHAGISRPFDSFVHSPQACRESQLNLPNAKNADTDADVRAESQLNTPRNAYVLQALQFVEENYSQDISLDMIAAQVGISPFYLSRLVKQELGITLVEYITTVRIRHACYLAATTRLSVADISEKVGYMNPTYFCRIFKRSTGLTIGQYRDLPPKERPC